ncbi:MAG: hypothetical protein PVF89_06100 [Lysobacterales bacterium]|jgi:hypothetical protein
MPNLTAEKFDRKAHWQKICQSQAPGQPSWFQARPTVSLQLIDRSRIGLADPIIDAGGPERCDHPPAVQYDAQKLLAGSGPGLRPRGGGTEEHLTSAERGRKFACFHLLRTG